MARIDEIAPDLFRISTYVSQFDLQFNHFLIRDDEPLLFHTGMRMMFPEVRDAVARLIEIASLRWISWSHFEVDECGALNEWLAVAPQAQPACSEVGAMVNLQDFSNRPPRGLAPGDVLQTGRHRYRYVPTPHLPHGWDAGMLFEETEQILLCSDLFHQIGQLEPITSDDVLDRWDSAIAAMQAHPVLMDYVPFTPKTRARLATLASSPHGTAVDAEAELYRRFAPRVRLFGLKHLRDEAAARDLAQQALLVAIQRLRANDVREPDQIGSFILGTSRMLAQAQRRTERRREELRAEYAHLTSTAVEAVEAVVDRARVQHCLRDLAQRERMVLMLTFYAERAAAEIGAALDMSPGAVRVARHRALGRMRECLERPRG